jgi:hypothetical protein
MTGTGDFGMFLTGVFGDRAPECAYQGLEQDQGRTLAVYRYSVPLQASRYQIRVRAGSEQLMTLAYEGRFWIDVNDAELHRMTIVVPKLPTEAATCRVETDIVYQRAQIGNSRLLLPESTLLTLWDAGVRYENRIAYSACRSFQSETVFRPEVDPAADAGPTPAPAAAEKMETLPPGKMLRIGLRTPIDAGGAFAGDAVEGQLLQAVTGKHGRILAPEGAVVRGRIVRAEQHFRPRRYFALGLKFYSLADGSREIPLALEAMSRTRVDQILADPADRRQGIGVFVLWGNQRRLDHGFVSEWKTTERKPVE